MSAGRTRRRAHSYPTESSHDGEGDDEVGGNGGHNGRGGEGGE